MCSVAWSADVWSFFAWQVLLYSILLGKYPFFNVRLALLSRTLSPGENLHDFVGPFLPYILLDTVVWLAHVTSAGWYA
jgi:hypothetical protein